VRVRWLRVALANLLEAAKYLERENPTAATASLERIVKAVYRLEHYPGIGRAGRIEGTRELVVAGTPYVYFPTVSAASMWKSCAFSIRQGKGARNYDCRAPIRQLSAAPEGAARGSTTVVDF